MSPSRISPELSGAFPAALLARKGLRRAGRTITAALTLTLTVNRIGRDESGRASARFAPGPPRRPIQVSGKARTAASFSEGLSQMGGKARLLVRPEKMGDFDTLPARDER